MFMNLKLWIGLMTFPALLGVSAIAQDSTILGTKNQKGTPEDMRRVTVDLSKLSWMQTQVGYVRTNQPPWPEGNCVTIDSKTNARSGLPSGGWLLVNMHAENFHEFVKRQRLERLELVLLPNHRCLVVDSRVAQEWLRTTPCPSCFSLEQRQSLRTHYPGFFRKDPETESWVGTTWVLVDRTDPDGIIARVLPGEKITFGAVEFICCSASGEIRGRRSWELNESKTPFSLSVYDVRSTNAYTGAVLQVTRRKDQMVLIPRAILVRSANTFGSDYYGTPAAATCRLAP
jgi:hypothetical protein